MAAKQACKSPVACLETPPKEQTLSPTLSPDSAAGDPSETSSMRAKGSITIACAAPSSALLSAAAVVDGAATGLGTSTLELE
eukprot:CAMPEP_0178415558 /NCGR_PEP_ID=MMETSP0689_2-20121128/23613_1 /TAXON_ID=160604 /ORGANISM="Amphidinium massartii, Strain CS-259" /LENGTH=81 /DNA_ID=CAMNT_0020036881 /DNA_START=201 /DNA_END=446 /DNA_ORIENTATION=+